ncbi:MAG: RNA-binding S4 domain-containing protein [Gammaproteobacteria bacterium]|nr:RNA-binding S4 domain-containing protein [Gammaproteobacteria bacterium]
MQQFGFRLTGDFVEPNRLLKLTGVCESGGAGKTLFAADGVSADGKVELCKP